MAGCQALCRDVILGLPAELRGTAFAPLIWFSIRQRPRHEVPPPARACSRVPSVEARPRRVVHWLGFHHAAIDSCSDRPGLHRRIPINRRLRVSACIWLRWAPFGRSPGRLKCNRARSLRVAHVSIHPVDLPPPIAVAGLNLAGRGGSDGPPFVRMGGGPLQGRRQTGRA